MAAADRPDRRGFARKLAGAAGAVFAALFGVPALAALIHPALRRGGRRWHPAGAAAEVERGAAKRFTFMVRAGWETSREAGFLVRQGEEIRAYSARCTHLGCKVRFADGAFRCPCHGGVFDLEGRPLEGPVTEPLARLPTRVANGRIEVMT